MPSWVGRLPSQVGYPVAGSLSADEYKALILVYLPIVVSTQLVVERVVPQMTVSFEASFHLGRVATGRKERIRKETCVMEKEGTRKAETNTPG